MFFFSFVKEKTSFFSFEFFHKKERKARSIDCIFPSIIFHVSSSPKKRHAPGGARARR